jgi:hypothetical protein
MDKETQANLDLFQSSIKIALFNVITLFVYVCVQTSVRK